MPTTTKSVVRKQNVSKEELAVKSSILQSKASKAKTLEKITIGGCDIYLGKKYTLDHKFDGDAPDGMKEIGATKFPFDNNVTVGTVYYDESRRQFDTGFYVHSHCNSRIDTDLVASRVDIYNTYIKEPYEVAINEDVFDTNVDFWKNYKITMTVNKTFDTSNPIELFDLYNAIQQGYICDVNETNPFYRKNAQFTISNLTQTKDKVKAKVKKQKSSLKQFLDLIEKDRTKLDRILLYINEPDPTNVDEDTLEMMYFSKFTSDKGDFIDRFTEAIDKYNTTKGKLEMDYFIVANRLYKAGYIKKHAGSFLTKDEDVSLGNSLQDVAKFCIADVKKKEVIDNLYEVFDRENRKDE